MSGYRILAPLGRGAGGEVVSALHLASGQPVALKLLDAPPTAAVIDRLAREVALSQRVGHPVLVRLLDCGVMDGRAFQAMELIGGTCLNDALGEAPFAPERALGIARALAECLAALHAAGAIHRDVKPGNIMLREDDAPVLMDLDGAAVDPAETAPGSDLVGSPAYLAPEILDDRPVDGRADVFSLGVVLYRLLTGRRPFDGTAAEVVEAIRHRAPLEPSRLVPGLSSAVDAVVMRCLAKDRDLRPQAGELAEDLAALTSRASPNRRQ